MEQQAAFAARELEASTRSNDRLQKEVDTLHSQTQYWDDIRRAAEQVEALSRQINAEDSEEVTELKRVRDHSQGLEKEHALLQKRFAEQEAKIAALQRTTANNKQAVTQAEQKAVEWEERARAAEGELESTTTQLEQAQETQAQMEVDISSLKDELETNLAAIKVAGVRSSYFVAVRWLT